MRTSRFQFGLAMMVLLSCTARAEVVSSSESGFESRSTVTVRASPAKAYRLTARIGDWWDPSHSYSGKAANLSLDAKAGGCFCERLDDGGSVEHARVVQARPAAILRLQGGLGPLQGEAVTGTLTWSFKAVPSGTEITQRYVVGGFIPGGASKLAGPVDQVLRGQMERLKAHLDR